MSEQEVQMSPAGALTFNLPQQQWTGSDVVQTALFAGQSMFIKKSDGTGDEYELHYLGLQVGGFTSLENAKFNAPEFARSVFGILGEFIKDDATFS